MDVHQLALLARQPSAVLIERQSFWGMPKRGLALILANAMFWQPVLVQAEGIVVSGTNTSLNQAGNGVPIVNIAAPNATGLSRKPVSAVQRRQPRRHPQQLHESDPEHPTGRNYRWQLQPARYGRYHHS